MYLCKHTHTHTTHTNTHTHTYTNVPLQKTLQWVLQTHYFSPNNMRVIKLRTVGWVRNVASIGHIQRWIALEGPKYHTKHLEGLIRLLRQSKMRQRVIFTYTPCILIIIKVFSPTDAQLDSLKNNFRFALKLTLKSFLMSIGIKI